MILKLLIGLAVLLAVFFTVAAMQPADFRVERRATTAIFDCKRMAFGGFKSIVNL